MRVRGKEDKTTKGFIKEFVGSRREVLIKAREKALIDAGTFQVDENNNVKSIQEIPKSLSELILSEERDDWEGQGFGTSDMGHVAKSLGNMVNSGMEPMDAALELSEEYPMEPAHILYVAAKQGIIDDHWADIYESLNSYKDMFSPKEDVVPNNNEIEISDMDYDNLYGDSADDNDNSKPKVGMIPMQSLNKISSFSESKVIAEKVVKRGNKWCVVPNGNSDKIFGSHLTKNAAESQLAALSIGRVVKKESRERGEFYVGWDEESQLYGVFNTKTDRCYSTFSSKEEAEQDATNMNG